MGVKSKGLTDVLKRLGKDKVDEMDEAAKRAAGLPGYDDLTEAAQKEAIKAVKKKGSGLTAKEMKEIQAMVNAPAKKAKSLADTEAGYSEAEKKQLKRALDAIGRDSTKMAKGGMPAKKAKAYNKGGYSNCGASVKPAQKAKK